MNVVPIRGGEIPEPAPDPKLVPQPELAKLFAALSVMAEQGRIIASAIVIVDEDGAASRFTASPMSAPEAVVYGLRRLERDLMAEADEHDEVKVLT